MATIKIHSPFHWAHKPATKRQKTHIWDELVAFAHGKSMHQEHWLKVALIAQVMLFLPLAALLMVSYQAPLIVTVAIFGLFIANIIACLGGSGIRAIASLLGIVMIDLLVLSVFAL